MATFLNRHLIKKLKGIAVPGLLSLVLGLFVIYLPNDFYVIHHNSIIIKRMDQFKPFILQGRYFTIFTTLFIISFLSLSFAFFGYLSKIYSKKDLWLSIVFFYLIILAISFYN